MTPDLIKFTHMLFVKGKDAMTIFQKYAMTHLLLIGQDVMKQPDEN